MIDETDFVKMAKNIRLIKFILKEQGILNNNSKTKAAYDRKSIVN